MMPSTILEQPAQLNNEGAVLIQQGKGNEAFKKLNEAIHELRASVRREGSTQRQQETSSNSERTPNVRISFLDTSLPTNKLASPGDSLLFQDPAFIDEVPIDSCEENIREISAVIFFNLALAVISRSMHERDTNSSTNFDCELARAAKILNSPLLASEREGPGLDIRLACAIANNLGQICRLREDEESARPFFVSLQHKVVSLVSNGEFDHSNRRHLEIFFANTIQIFTRNCLTAPCA